MAKQTDSIVDPIDRIIRLELSKPEKKRDKQVIFDSIERNVDLTFVAILKYGRYFEFKYLCDIFINSKYQRQCIHYLTTFVSLTDGNGMWEEYVKKYDPIEDSDVVINLNMKPYLHLLYLMCYKSLKCFKTFIKLLKKHDLEDNFSIYKLLGDNVTRKSYSDVNIKDHIQLLIDHEIPLNDSHITSLISNMIVNDTNIDIIKSFMNDLQDYAYNLKWDVKIRGNVEICSTILRLCDPNYVQLYHYIISNYHWKIKDNYTKKIIYAVMINQKCKILDKSKAIN